MAVKSQFINARRGFYAAWVLLAFSSASYAQSIFDFTGPAVLVTGDDLQSGAVYQYSAVAADIDALVEVRELNNATLTQLDDPTGVVRALQPEINGNAVGSYVEFGVSFVASGTSTPISVSGVFSALDLDSMLEFDTFFDVSDYTVETNSDLSLTVSDPQTLEVSGGGSGFSPTSAANTTVAVSVGVNDLSGFIYRAGVNGNATRQTSLLFEPLSFNAAIFTNINDAPKAVADNNSVARNSTLTVAAENGLLANDTDVDIGIDTDLLVVDSISIGADTHGTDSSISLVEGELTVNGNGSYQFIPAVNYSGSVSVVSYQISDGSGGSDSATLSLLVTSDGTPPIVIPDSAVVIIDEDINNDGFISSAEISGQIDVSVQLPAQAMAGDTVSVNYAEDNREVLLDANQLLENTVSVVFSVPADGELILVSASLIDAAGNRSVVSSDEAILDISAPEAPVVTITGDQDNSGFISAQEFTDSIIVVVSLPAGAGVNDRLTITTGATTTEIILTPVDIANGSVSTTLPAPTDGDGLSVVSQLTDEAGNLSASGSDSAIIDITAPAEPGVDSLMSSSSTPGITGTLPTDGTFLLSVEINGVVYVSGDGQLTESADGDWTLVIPPNDALIDGVYDVSAVVTDMAGNSTGDSTNDELTVDLQTPVTTINNIDPEIGAALRTGVGGLGCSIQTANSDQASGPKDFLLLFLLIMAVLSIHRRKSSSRRLV